MPDAEDVSDEQSGQIVGNNETDQHPASSDGRPAVVGPDDQSSQPADRSSVPEAENLRAETSSSPGSPDLTTVGDSATRRHGPPGDFPEPPAADDKEEFKWDEEALPAENYIALGKKLAEKKDFYRRSAHCGGLILAPEHVNASPVALDDPARLMAAILDYVRVSVVKGGVHKGGLIPPRHLRAMSLSELFLGQFNAVDEVVDRAMYLPPDFRPTVPGYNDGGFGHRVLHVGPALRIARTPDALNRFLDVISLESPADRANAYAAGLTVLLRNFWPGGKPIVVVTANKSHSGKETLISCIAGLTPMNSVSYQTTNWAFERNFVGALRLDPRVGVINIDNVRLDGSRLIRSAFLERFLTDPQPFLFSTGTGRAARIWNNIVVTMSTNEGSLSPDLMNRSLPIRLVTIGDILRRSSPIGNPKHEYLPRYREQIEAEFHGMIANWRDAGYPLATDIRHPSALWAQTIGGILRVNGVDHFLENLDTRRNVDDLVRRSLGLLGAARPGEWRTASEWSKTVADLGLVKALIPDADRDSTEARARGTGVALSAHVEEALNVETEDHVYEFKLEKQRKRFPGETQPRTKYAFRVVSWSEVSVDAGHDD